MGYWYTVCTLAGVNVMLAYSVYASFMTGQVSIGQAAFFGMGAYAAASLTVLAGVDLATAVFAGGLAGLLGSLFVAVPMLRLKGFHLTIATVAFAEAVRILLSNARYGWQRSSGAAGNLWVGPDGPVGFRHINYLNEHGIGAGEYALLTWIAALAVAAGFFIVERSRLGRVLRTIEEDEIVARSIGINTARVKVGTFALGGFLAGIAGGFYAHLLTFISGNDFVIHLSTIALAYVVIGGGQTLWGPLLGATIFTLLPELLRPVREFRVEVFGLLMLGMMLFRPAGLISAANVRALWERLRRRPAPGTPRTAGAGEL
jgi:branched-chain amino acid transport system permease protein